MSSVSPKWYQEDAVNNALEIFRHVESQLQQASDEKSRRIISAFNGCVLLEAPTGAGKTLMAGLIAETFSRNDHHYNAKVIWFWFTPFSNLVNQAKSALKKEFNGLKIRDLACDRVAYKADSGDVFITTWASVAASNAATRNLRKSGDVSLSLDEFIPELRASGFRIGVVIDEAHNNFTKASEAVKFYRDIMSPEFSLLITATPNDSDVDKFKKAAGLEEIHKIQVSRNDAVIAGLIKEAVKSIVYLVPDNHQQFVDFELTALEDGLRTHQTIKNALADLKINLTPLMLVQVDSKGKAGEEVIEKTKQRLITLGVSEESIAWYTADEPNDDLLVVARDESKEVLIFKVAVALGFDAPRAFTLVSLRGTKSTDFGIQVVGRILRVHRYLQPRATNNSLPEILRFGYVFLADSATQGGLLSAAEKINAIKTKMSAITPNTVIAVVAGETEVQVSIDGQTEFFHKPYIPLSWEGTPVPAIGQADHIIQPSIFRDTTLPFLNSFIAPESKTINDNKYSNCPQLTKGNCFFKLNETVPTRFKTERMPLGTEDLVKSIVAMVKLDESILNEGRRKSIKVSRQTISIFNQAGTVVDTIQAKLSAAEIARRAQKVFFDAKFIDPRDLHRALLERLTIEYNEYKGSDLSEQELLNALDTILATYPKLIRNATKSCMAKFKQVFPTSELPKQIEAPDSINRSSLNIYGIIPSDLNETERKFAQLLDTDSGQTISWWHRNEPRKAHSVGIVLPDGYSYFPDFIVGINKSLQGDGMLLIEIKGGHILNGEDTLEKINAEHKIYGKPLMLTLQEDGNFYIMRYIESSNKIEKDRIFRIENMRQY